MFCSNCGSQIPDNAAFCGSCGTKVGGGSTSEIKTMRYNKDEVVMTVSPKFVVIEQLITSLGEVLMSSLLLLYIFGRLIFTLVHNPISAIFVIIGLILLGAGVKTVFKKFEYDNLEYVFYGDRMEYIDGFLNKSKKQVKYTSIREISLHRTVYDRIFGLGRVRISTPAEMGRSRVSGINIKDLADAESVYKDIKEITGE